MSDTQTYLLRPQAPLVFRSGKPFASSNRDAPQYPSPAAWSGLMQTCRMDAGLPIDIVAQGVLLVRECEQQHALFLHRPADAFPDREQACYLRMSPALRNEDERGCDLDPRLAPVLLDDDFVGKPGEAPAFWSMDDYVRWASDEPLKFAAGEAWQLPAIASRVHVRIDRARDAAEDGQLHRSEAWDCGPHRTEAGFTAHHWCFAGRGPAGLSPQLVSFGGERRLSWLEPMADDALLSIPQPLKERLTGSQGIALTFATPALFARGWCPGWLDDALTGSPPDHPELRLRLIAVCIPHWQPISGWDLQTQSPKPTRRAVPAGATFWFEVEAGDASTLWLQSISDQDKDRRAGFGLALVRPWNTELKEIVR